MGRDSLDPTLRAVLTDRLGEIIEAAPATSGVHADYTGTIHTSRATVFIKAVRLDQPRLLRMQAAEARIAPVVPLAPRLLDHVQRDGWDVLVFEHVVGRHVDLSPGSPDLDPITMVLDELHTALNPAPVAGTASVAEQWARLSPWRRLRADPPADLHHWTAARLDQYADTEPVRLEQLSGDSLLHTDLHALNILVGDTVHVVDWAWARTGPPWLDAAMLGLRLVEAGHSIDDGLNYLWSTKPGQLVTDDDLLQLGIQVLGNWEILARRDHQRPHLHGLAGVARAWIEASAQRSHSNN